MDSGNYTIAAIYRNNLLKFYIIYSISSLYLLHNFSELRSHNAQNTRLMSDQASGEFWKNVKIVLNNTQSLIFWVKLALDLGID